MYITEALIRKFFDDACTPAEADAVALYLKENPDEMKRYLGGDWVEAERKPKRMWLAWTAAAAVVVAFGIATLEKQTKEKPILAARAAVTPQPLENRWIDTTASGGEAKKLILADGSVVTLSANSHLRYQSPFPAGVRDVTLEGQATFDVARDARRPFRVKAGSTTTTVLGTRFNVLENAGGVMVRLYQGKVSVHAAARDFVLSPGEQMQYQSGKDLAEVSVFERRVKHPAIPAAPPEAGKTIEFDNAPLPRVIDTLQKRYHVAIAYDEKELSRMYFSGTVLPSDSLETILHVIVNMNGLKLSKGSQGFILSISPN